MAVFLFAYECKAVLETALSLFCEAQPNKTDI